MLQAMCAASGYAGAGLGSAQTQRRRELLLARELPAPARFDRENHLRIMQQVHAHLSRHDERDAYAGTFRCEGNDGDLFFAMRLYWPQLQCFPRYPRSVRWSA